MADGDGKFTRYFDLFKFLIGTVGLGLVTLFVNGQIQDREVAIKERAQSQENLAKYINLAIDKDLSKRRDFAKYFEHLSSSGDERDRWVQYVKFIEAEIKVNKDLQDKRTKEADELRAQVASIAGKLENLQDSAERDKLVAELAAAQARLNETKSEVVQLRQDLSGSTSDAPANVDLRSLVGEMDSPRKQERLNATGQLVSEYADSTQAVQFALDILTEPYLLELSDNGRVNIFVYLAATEATAWTPGLLQRWQTTLQTIERRHAEGVSAIGPVTRTRLQTTIDHIARLKPVVEGRG